MISSMLPWFPYCYTLLYVCLYDFPSESSHGARCYASHCVRSNNICHKCSLRCNSHSQPGLLIYSFVSYKPTLNRAQSSSLTHMDLPLCQWESCGRESCRGCFPEHGVSKIPLVGLHILSMTSSQLLLCH